MKEKEMKEKKTISMADANLLESNYSHLLRLTFSTDIKRSDYIKSVARYTAWFRLVQCVVPINFSRQSPPGTFINLPLVCALNTASKSGLLFLLYISRYLTKFKGVSAM